MNNNINLISSMSAQIALENYFDTSAVYPMSKNTFWVNKTDLYRVSDHHIDTEDYLEYVDQEGDYYIYRIKQDDKPINEVW